MRIELVVTDLDGTLWPELIASPGTVAVHDRSRRVLGELAAAGIPVLAATGRRRRRARRTLDADDLSFDGVFHDGALGVTATDVVFHVCAFTNQAVTGLVEVFDEFGYQPSFETDADDLVTLSGDRSTFPPEFVDPEGLVDLAAPLPVPVYSAIAAVTTEVAPGVVEAINASGWGRAAATRIMLGETPASVIKARSASCSKWSAVERYCDYIGADPTRVLAIGDNDNDVELLANAAVALAPRTASRAARSVAHHLVAPAVEGGWAELLEFL